jgi:protein-S-isoprenylcysteine O-methyltransferase Ste14
LPALGPRGEGWVVLQVGLIAALVAAAVLGPPWWSWGALARRLLAALLGLGGASLGAGALRALGRQLTPLPRPVEGGTLRDGGAYGLVRHPMYGAVLLLGLAAALATSPAALLPLALAAPFLDAKRRLEERWLVEQHPGYAAYLRRVPRQFIPFVW